MLRLFSSVVLLCLSISSFANFTQYPTGIDTDGSYTIKWDPPNGSSVLNYWVNEKINGTTTRVASSGSSVSLTGRGDGTYTYELWIREEYTKRGELFQRNILEHSIDVTVSVTVNPPGKPDTPVNNYTGDYTVSWDAVSGATKYILEERKDSGSWVKIVDSNIRSISRNDKSAGTYYYRAMACVNSKCSNWSETASTNVIYPPSSSPSFTSDINQYTYTSKRNLVVNWSSVNTATKYLLEEYVNGSWVTRANENILGKTFDDRVAGNYIFRVRAANLGGNGPAKQQTFKVIQNPNLSGPSTARGAFTLTWYGPGNYTNVKDGNTIILNKVTGSSSTITDTDGTHQYRAQRCFHNGELADTCDDYGLPLSVTVLNIPGTPSSISVPSFNGSNSASVSWGSASGTVHKYDVDYQKNNGAWTNLYDGTSRSKTLTMSEGTYKFRVRACNTLNTDEKCSSWRESSSITASKPSTNAITLNSTSNSDSFRVNWSSVTNGLTYRLEESVNGGSWSEILNDNKLYLDRTNRQNKTYAYRVRACNDIGCSSYSATKSISVAITPGVPSSLTTPTNNSLAVSWGVSSGELSYYNMDYQTGSTWHDGYQGSNRNKTLSLTPGTYNFRVQACQTTGSYTSCSGWRSASGIQLSKPASTPTLDLHSEDTDGDYTVKWGAINFTQRYTLQEKVDSGSWVTIQDSNSVTKDIVDKSNSTYYYQVKACNALGCTGYSSAKKINVALTTGKPSLSTLPSLYGQKSLSISWAQVSGRVTRYSLERNANNSWSEIYSGANLAFTDPNLTQGTYLYRVKACNKVDTFENCNTSNSSNAVLVSSPNQSPTLDVDEFSSPGLQIPVAWSAVNNTSSYVLEEKSAGGSWQQIYSGSALEKSVSSKPLLSEYSYRVKACNEIGCGSYSPVASVKILNEIDFAIPDADYIEPVVPDSDIVGKLPGSLAVSGGAASYSMPISVAPGRHGMQPAISLNYNSQSGEGIAGYGWSLSASSSITRCGSSFAVDNTTRAVRLDSEDKLCLDGQRLILTSGTYGEHGSEYSTEKYSKRRVKLFNNIQSTSSYFEIYSTDNKKHVYGNSSDSRFVLQGSSVPNRWHIKKSEDSFQNSIIYDYENSFGVHYLSDIWYTGTGNNKGTRNIHFSYLNRENIHKGYVAGAYYVNKKQLRKISILISGVEYDYYQLDHIGSPQKLEKVSHCAGGDCLYTEFEWYESESTFSKNDELHWRRMDGTIVDDLLGIDIGSGEDIDGDGIFDLRKDGKYFITGATGKRYPTSDDDWIYGPSADDTTLVKIAYYNFNGDADVNGDGKKDYLYVDENNRVKIIFWDASDDSRSTLDTGFTTSCVPPNVWDSRIPGDPYCASYVSDFDGDGISDIFFAYAGSGSNITYRLLKGCILNSSNCTKGFIDQNFSFDSNKAISWSPIDINGDGLVDLARMSGESIAWLQSTINNGSISFIQKSVEHLVPGNHGVVFSGTGSARSTHFWLDANRDGLQDLMLLGLNSDARYTWYYVTNKGNGEFEAPVNTGESEFLKYEQIVNGQPTPNSLTYNHYARQIDFNNDGVMDILVPRRQKIRANCSDSTGQPCGLDSPTETHPSAYDVFEWKIVTVKENDGVFSFEHHDLPSFQAQGMKVYVMDVDGDGFADLNAFLGNESWWYRNGEPLRKHFEYTGALEKRVHTWTRDYHNANLLENVITYNGRVTESKLTYKPLSFDHSDGSKIYRPTDDEVQFPYGKFTNTMKVVSEIDQNDGVGGMNTTRYYFEKAIFHKQGRGFQGFSSILEHKLATDMEVEKNFYTEFPYSGMTKEENIRIYSSGRLLQQNATEELESDIGVAEGVVFPYAKESSVKKFNLATGSLLTTISSTTTFDNKANLTDSTVVTEDDTAKHIKTSKQIFVSSSGCENVLQEQETKANVTYKAFMGSNEYTSGEMWSKQEFSDWQSCQPRQQTQTGSDAASGVSVSPANLTTNYVFDSYGNIERTTVSGGTGKTLITPRISISMYETEGYFVEYAKNGLWGDLAYSSQVTLPRFGNVESTIDPNGLTSMTHYNNFGQALSVETQATTDGDTPDVYNVTTWCSNTWCPENGLAKTEIYQAGAPTQTTYIDVLGRDIRSEAQGFDGTLIVASKTFNHKGYLIQETMPHYSTSSAAVTSYMEFDALGRAKKKITDSSPSYFTTTYAFNGLQVDATVASSDKIFTVSRVKNSLNQIIMTEDADNNRGYFRYDGFGNPTQIIDVNGSVISAAYNGMGNKQWFNDPNMGLWKFTTNGLGEVVEQLDANQQLTVWDYDTLGRVRKQTEGSQISEWQYDEPGHYGQLRSQTRNNGFAKYYTYDQMQRVRQTTTQLDSYTFTENTAYDLNYGRIKGVRYASGEQIHTQYNNFGFIDSHVRMADNTVLAAIESMSAQGDVNRMVFGNGLAQIFQRYLPSGSVDTVCTTSLLNATCAANDAQYIDYDYDTLGNLSFQDNQSAAIRYDYIYDNLHRLDEAKLSFQGNVVDIIDYGYDSSGNFTRKSDYANDYLYGNVDRSAGGNAGPNAVRQITKLNNQVVNYAYDNNGNMLSGDGRTITYDYLNKPLSIIKDGVTSTFKYGADSQRFKQTTVQGTKTTTTYYVDKSFEKIIISQGGVTTSDLEKTYIGSFAVINNAVVGPIDSSPLVYLSADRQGSNTTITDGSITLADGFSVADLIIQHRDYGPFGQVRDINGNKGLSSHISTKRGFTGHEQLPEVKLIHMNGRAYDYQLGRFLSVDPMLQFPENSQSANPYSYILNNPLAGTDPSGYETVAMEEKDRVLITNDGAYLDQGGDTVIKIDSITQSNGNTIDFQGVSLGQTTDKVGSPSFNSMENNSMRDLLVEKVHDSLSAPWVDKEEVSDYISRRESISRKIIGLEEGFWYKGRAHDIADLKRKIADLDYALSCRADKCGLETSTPFLNMIGIGGVAKGGLTLTFKSIRIKTTYSFTADDFILTDALSPNAYRKLLKNIAANGLINNEIKYVVYEGAPYVVHGSNRLSAMRYFNKTSELKFVETTLPFQDYKVVEDLIRVPAPKLYKPVLAP